MLVSTRWCWPSTISQRWVLKASFQVLCRVPSSQQLNFSPRHILQVMHNFINEWQEKLGVKIVCSQVKRAPAVKACREGSQVLCRPSQHAQEGALCDLQLRGPVLGSGTLGGH